MKPRHTLFTWLLTALVVLPAAGLAQDILMVRSTSDFPETMTNLQQAILDSGYKITRVQRVDIGLTKSGYQTDKYRLVFFGDPKEIQTLTKSHPRLIPFLPLKVVLFAEGDQTLMVTTNPAVYARFFNDPKLAEMFQRWERDLETIFEKVRVAKDD